MFWLYTTTNKICTKGKERGERGRWLLLEDLDVVDLPVSGGEGGRVVLHVALAGSLVGAHRAKHISSLQESKLKKEERRWGELGGEGRIGQEKRKDIPSRRRMWDRRPFEGYRSGWRDSCLPARSRHIHACQEKERREENTWWRSLYYPLSPSPFSTPSLTTTCFVFCDTVCPSQKDWARRRWGPLVCFLCWSTTSECLSSNQK